jgi:hypothetical protein
MEHLRKTDDPVVMGDIPDLLLEYCGRRGGEKRVIAIIDAVITKHASTGLLSLAEPLWTPLVAGV